MKMVSKPLKIYLSNLDSLFGKVNISLSNSVQNLKILQLGVLISCMFIILPICYLLMLKKCIYRVHLFFHENEKDILLH